MNMENKTDPTAYWKANLRLIITCLIIWFLGSLGCGVLFVDLLNNIQVGGFKLGFWFAQQGSIFTFVAVIVYYVNRANYIDRKFGQQE